jgi:PQQ-dependent dehydrogenase (s-GDH family)
MVNPRDAKSKPKKGNGIVTVTLFGLLLLLSVMPTMVGNSSSFMKLSALAQTEEQPIPPVPANKTQQQVGREAQLPRQEGFSTSVLATNFSAPYNILYGPDDALWITERVGKNITRLDPSNGSKLSSMPVPNVHQSSGQDGLMGMAFDPDFNDTNYIYVAYTYDADLSEELARQTKITRFTYDSTPSNISKPVDIISGLSGSIDHNSGRLAFDPDDKLYYTIGDQGKNYLTLYCLDNQAQKLPTAEQVAAQNWSAYEGKVLRINPDPPITADSPDASIPANNPVINGVRSHIFTYGHRNAQGIAIGPNGVLYISEHGDKSDDEVNRLQAGGNYGWPYVAGYNDSQAYQYVNWSAAENCEDLEFNNQAPAPPSVPTMNESEFDARNFVPPLDTFYTVENDYNFTFPGCEYICWPTVAPSSLRFYSSDAVPGWENNNTFLMPTLKGGRIFQLTLNDNGTSLAREPVELFRSENRYRDVAFDPDGRTIYAITDSSGPVQALEGGATDDLWNPGSVLVFRYEGNSSSSARQ